MNLKDRLGNLVTTNQSEVIDAVDQFTDLLLRLGAEVPEIIKAADKYTDNYLLQLYGALFYLYGLEEMTHKRAHYYLQRARALLVDPVSERE